MPAVRSGNGQDRAALLTLHADARPGMAGRHRRGRPGNGRPPHAVRIVDVRPADRADDPGPPQRPPPAERRIGRLEHARRVRARLAQRPHPAEQQRGHGSGRAPGGLAVGPLEGGRRGRRRPAPAVGARGPARDAHRRTFRMASPPRRPGNTSNGRERKGNQSYDGSTTSSCSCGWTAKLPIAAQRARDGQAAPPQSHRQHRRGHAAAARISAPAQPERAPAPSHPRRSHPCTPHRPRRARHESVERPRPHASARGAQHTPTGHQATEQPARLVGRAEVLRLARPRHLHRSRRRYFPSRQQLIPARPSSPSPAHPARHRFACRCRALPKGRHAWPSASQATNSPTDRQPQRHQPGHQAHRTSSPAPASRLSLARPTPTRDSPRPWSAPDSTRSATRLSALRYSRKAGG